MRDPIPLTNWVFQRFQSSRSGMWRLLARGTRPDGEHVETSVVAAIDVPARVVTTHSGSRYRLDGPWVYAGREGAPQELADILAWYGEWTPKEGA